MEVNTIGIEIQLQVCLPRIASTNLPLIRAARNPGDAAVASARGPCGHRSGAKLSVAISDLLGRWGGLN